MDASRRQARSRLGLAVRNARRDNTPESAQRVAYARRDYAAERLAEYIRRLVDEHPPLTPEQVETLRGLFDPIPVNRNSVRNQRSTA